MPDVIQFHCPACCITLKVPLEAAGQKGPCPHCQQMILAPNPYTGVPACRLAEEAPETIHHQELRAPEPQGPRFEPFQGVPVAKPEPALHSPARIEPSQPAAWPAALAIGVMAAILGFAGGYQSASLSPQPAAQQVEAKPATVEPKIAPATPPPVLSAAKSTLEGFLAAPDWKARGKFVLFPETILPRMETFHQKHPDGPTEATRLVVEHCEASPTTNLMLVVFRVHTSSQPSGFPVAVAETPEGWKVDWQPFIEFKDELFVEFVTGKAGDTGTFHLLLQPSTGATEAEDKMTYILSDPVKQREFLATVRKGTDTANSLADITKDGIIATPVLELSRHVRPDGSYDLEIVGVPATNWRPVNR